MKFGRRHTHRPGRFGFKPGHSNARYLAVVVLFGILIGLIVWHRGRQSSPTPAAGDSPSLSPSSLKTPEPDAQMKVDAPGPAAAAGAETPTGDPTERARRLIHHLSSVKLVNGQIPPEAIDDFHERLLELEGLDLAAIPAMEEYFQRRENVRYDTGTGTNLLGASSLRIAIMQLLLDVSAPDNEEFQGRLLQTVSDPEEVALLARQLEIAVPGQFRDSIVDAAKASLEMIRNGKLPGRDPAPLLKVLEKFGAAEKAGEGR